MDVVDVYVVKLYLDEKLSLRRGISGIQTVALFKPIQVRALAEVRWNFKSCSGFV
jgi:hypothetical protein